MDKRFIASGASRATGLAVDAAHVYWADARGDIGRANLDGTRVDPSFITVNDAGVGVVGADSVAVAGGHVYCSPCAGTSRGIADHGRRPLRRGGEDGGLSAALGMPDPLAQQPD